MCYNRCRRYQRALGNRGAHAAPTAQSTAQSEAGGGRGAGLTLYSRVSRALIWGDDGRTQSAADGGVKGVAACMSVGGVQHAAIAHRPVQASNWGSRGQPSAGAPAGGQLAHAARSVRAWLQARLLLHCAAHAQLGRAACECA